MSFDLITNFFNPIFMDPRFIIHIVLIRTLEHSQKTHYGIDKNDNIDKKFAKPQLVQLATKNFIYIKLYVYYFVKSLPNIHCIETKTTFKTTFINANFECIFWFHYCRMSIVIVLWICCTIGFLGLFQRFDF